MLTNPSDDDLRAMRHGDAFHGTVGCTKTDQFGEIHAPFGYVLPFREGEPNAARGLRDLLLEERRGGDVPLFVDEQGHLLSHATLDRVLDRLLEYCFGKAVAATHSWHSFRIGLACSLRAAGADDATIQLMCRWLSPDSLRLYRRLGTSESVSWADRAAQAHVDTTQMTNLPMFDASEGFATLRQHYCDTTAAKEATILAALEGATGSGKRPRAASVAAPVQSSDTESDANDGPHVPEPLTQANATGRQVLVPRGLWPDYPCNENDGRGWRAKVISCKRGIARIRFTAASPEGSLYPDVHLQLSSLGLPDQSPQHNGSASADAGEPSGSGTPWRSVHGGAS